MSKYTLVEARRRRRPLRMVIQGPPGSGKTYTMLQIGHLLSEHFKTKFAVHDTENDSAQLYYSRFPFKQIDEPIGALGDTDDPEAYLLDTIERLEYFESIPEIGVLGADSLTHAWKATLRLVGKVSERIHNNKFAAWGKATPIHEKLFSFLINTRLQVICTMRSKMYYVQEKDDQNNKTVIRRVGMKAVARDDSEYEFDIVGDMDTDNNLTIIKTRCEVLTNQKYHKPGEKFVDILIKWLEEGSDAPDDEVQRKKVLVKFQELRAAFNDDKAYTAALLEAGVPEASLDNYRGTREQFLEIYRKVKAKLPEAPAGAGGFSDQSCVAAVADFDEKELAFLMSRSGAKNKAQLTAWIKKQGASKNDLLKKVGYEAPAA